MTRTQKIYRLLRKFHNAADARYAAIRLNTMTWDEIEALRS